MKWDELLETAIARNAADILLSPGSPPMLRIAGELVPQDLTPLTGEVIARVIERIAPEGALEALRRTKDLEYATHLGGRRFRCTAYIRGGEPALALRLLPATIPHPADLGLPRVVAELMMNPTGLVLFTGAAGQGKSTSQASLIQFINERQARHIVTIEDPIEYVHAPARSVIDQREVGRDTPSFAGALRHVLRQTPDVIQIGEMRDLDTMQAAMSIAETGHLVLSTVHTHDAVQALVRIIDAFPDGARAMVRVQLSMTMTAIINQRLVRGTRGDLVLACEVLLNTPAVAAQIRDGHFDQIYSSLELDRASGMQTLNSSLEALVKAGRIDAELAARYLVKRESRRPTTPPPLR